MIINSSLEVSALANKLSEFWKVSGRKILSIEEGYDHDKGAPVFTRNGAYTSRGWTEWTQGFQYGSAILQFDATGDEKFLEIGRNATLEKMAGHVGHFGVHDHGFNNSSTYGNLLRLVREGKIPQEEWEIHFYELALKLSGAVQANRWTALPEGGYIYSFNGPHSLFVDTIRSLRALVISHELGFSHWGEKDATTDLLERAMEHAIATAKYSVYYGEGRDDYDKWGRTAHESIFNTNDGSYRCPNAQQGFSGFSTWTRGLAWAITGFAELLEYIEFHQEQHPDDPGLDEAEQIFLKAAKATSDFYIKYTPIDGIPYWDTGAPNLHLLGDVYEKTSDPYNDYEPIDSSAACIAAQGLLRLGHYLNKQLESDGQEYWQAGLTVVNHLFQRPYISLDPDHQGLILHSVYHRPYGWDHVPEGSLIPNGESSMWGDYHAREVALYLQRILDESHYLTFFNCVKDH